MPEAVFNFPPGFIWGCATSAYQVEGDNHNSQWYAWEQQEGNIIEGQRSGLANDWWGGRWQEDFDRAAESGQNALRFSIEWSRVQPEPDRWDHSALDHYRQMLAGLLERGLQPMVTLHHFSDPLWLTEMGGWENPQVVSLFAVYSRKVCEALKSYTSLWCTINEPNVYAMMGYLYGEFPPGKRDIGIALQVMTIMIQAHAAAYHTIKRIQPDSKVGLAYNWRGFNPVRRTNPLDILSAKLCHHTFNDLIPGAVSDGKLRLLIKNITLPSAARTQDFIGLNYYTADLVRFAFKLDRWLQLPQTFDTSENGFISSQPLEFFRAIRWALRFGLPVYITENGTEDSQDEHRRRYLVEHIMQLWRAVNFNFPIKGYFHWTLVDNFEWDRGWTQRFGLWALDNETQIRSKRPSADLYAEICRSNAISTEMVQQYAPQVFEKLYPG